MAICEKVTNLIFDILAAIISLSDIITDIIVTIGFYQNDRMVFFGFSLTFIILAQIAYIFTFIVEIGYESRPGRVFLMFLFLIPFSPILSFIFYLTEDPNSWMCQFLTNWFPFDVSFSLTSVDQNKPKLKQWMKRKLRKHLGFIMEALIEACSYILSYNFKIFMLHNKYTKAFPQSILQMCAIVIYNEANIVSIISILISMLSVSSKTFILSIQFSMNIKSLMFNWLCCVTDFVGIFFAVSWVFYDTTSETLNIIAYIWLLKVLCCVVPLVFVFSIGIYYEGLKNLVENIDITQCPSGCFGIFCAWLMVQILWAFGMILGTLALEIFNFIFLAGPMFLVGSTRIPSNAEKSRLWLDVLEWIKSARKQTVDDILSLTKQQDRIIRICCINKTVIDKAGDVTKYDPIFVEFLNENAKDCYMNVDSLYAIRSAHKPMSEQNGPPPSFGKIFLILLCIPYVMAEQYYKDNIATRPTKAKITMGFAIVANFVIGPFYYLSKLFNIFLPFIIVISLYVEGYDLFRDIDTFQVVMLLIYVTFEFMIVGIGFSVMREQYLLWHIMPGEQIDSNYKPFNVTKAMIEATYNKMITIPVRNALVNKKYGDIGKIIIEYCEAIELDETFAADEAQETALLLEK